MDENMEVNALSIKFSVSAAGIPLGIPKETIDYRALAFVKLRVLSIRYSAIKKYLVSASPQSKTCLQLVGRMCD